jgi:hypothetical protein
MAKQRKISIGVGVLVIHPHVNVNNQFLVTRRLKGASYGCGAEEWFREGKHQWTVYLIADCVSGSVSNPEPHKHEDWRWETLDALAARCGPNDWIPVKALLAQRKKLGL